ncbi:hypothetical protein ENBRE01_3046, partial [Enteropsectra breve]
TNINNGSIFINMENTWSARDVHAYRKALIESIQNPVTLPYYDSIYRSNENKRFGAVEMFTEPFQISNEINFGWNNQRIVRKNEYDQYTVYLLQQEDVYAVGDALTKVKIDMEEYGEYLYTNIADALKCSTEHKHLKEFSFKLSRIYLPVFLTMEKAHELSEKAALLNRTEIDSLCAKFYMKLKGWISEDEKIKEKKDRW